MEFFKIIISRRKVCEKKSLCIVGTVQSYNRHKQMVESIASKNWTHSYSYIGVENEVERVVRQRAVL